MDENNTVDTEALKERIKEIVEKGNVSRIQIRKNETVIMNIPVNAGILGGVLGVMAAPWAMIAGTVATLGLNCPFSALPIRKSVRKRSLPAPS